MYVLFFMQRKHKGQRAQSFLPGIFACFYFAALREKYLTKRLCSKGALKHKLKMNLLIFLLLLKKPLTNTPVQLT